MIEEAIRIYHDLLSQENLASETAAALLEFQIQRGLSIQGRPLCQLLRPHFITQHQYQSLSSQCRHLFSALKKTRDRLLIDKDMLPLLKLSDEDWSLFNIQTGYDSECPIGRWDTFFDVQGQFHITEFNSDSPAGAGYCDELSEAFLSLPVMTRFTNRYDISYHGCRTGIVEIILKCYSQWRKTQNEAPRLAIVDWDHVRTTSEFPLFRKSFESLGISVQIADPRHLEYRNQILYACGQPVNCVYKRVLVKELLQNCGLETPLIQAARESAICMVNSLNSRLYGKKTLLAIMSDPHYHHWYSAEEVNAIQQHLPWTRVLAEGYTTHSGQIVDLIPFVIAHQAELVLKPDHNHGGRGVIIGDEVTRSDWEQAVAVSLGQANIVQERLPMAKVAFPFIRDCSLSFSYRIADTAPFVVDGLTICGCLSAPSESSIVNVSSGSAATLPVMVIAGK